MKDKIQYLSFSAPVPPSAGLKSLGRNGYAHTHEIHLVVQQPGRAQFIPVTSQDRMQRCSVVIPTDILTKLLAAYAAQPVGDKRVTLFFGKQAQCHSLGRGGHTCTCGVILHEEGGTITLQPITSRGTVAPCEVKLTVSSFVDLMAQYQATQPKEGEPV